MREQTLMRMAQIRSSHLECAPELRRFIEEAVARQHPDEYFRALEIEHMASVVLGGAAADYRMERWLEAERWLDALVARCASQEELEAAVVDVAGSGDLFVWELFVWCLIDRESADGLDLWAAAERVVLARLGPEGERADRRGPASDLLAMCRAKQGNRLRVAGDVTGGFELVRKAASLLHPGGNVYVTARVSSFYASAAIAAGHFELAEKKARRMLKLFQWLDYPVGEGEALNILTHLSFLAGKSPRRMLSGFLEKNLWTIPERLKTLTKTNLIAAIIYFHDGVGAEAILLDLERRNLQESEKSWLRYFRTLMALAAGEPARAAEGFSSAARDFMNLGKQNHAYFALLLEALSHFDSDRLEQAAERAAVAAQHFSSSRFYGGVAARAAENLLASIEQERLDRRELLNMIEAALSPARKDPGRTQSHLVSRLDQLPIPGPPSNPSSPS